MELPDWLDRTVYPFTPHMLDVGAGRMSYVDEGEGPPLLLLHGNPTWSFLYRHLITHLAPPYRCVAPDYLGFGLSDKPAGWSYHPAQHAQTVARLVEHLDLRDLTLVVQDWGGPIGLHLAVEWPERVRRLVIMNTWAWPVDDDPHFRWFSRLVGGPVGRLLIRRLNAFARWVMPLALVDRSRWTPAVRRHYVAPLDTRQAREGAAVLPGAVAGAAPWLRTVERRLYRLTDRPALLLWGLHDVAFRTHELDRWRALLPEAEVRRLPVGHYVQEDLGERLGPMVEAFLQRTD